MRLGLFGGSFDPVHRGHVGPVQEARRTLGLDRVLYLPTAKPPHKQDPETAPEAPAWARYTMVELAVLHEGGLYVSSHELRPDRPSYTVETLEHFRRGVFPVDLHLILGSDALLGLPGWRRWRELPELARLVVLTRPGSELRELRGRLAPELEELLDRGEIDVIEDARVDVSSTEIRRRLAESEAERPAWLEERVPSLVVDYLAKYRFYR